MSYVRTSTANDLGRRPLGWYENASFPLPTTGMSRPIRPGLGWDNGPQPNTYAQPRTLFLNGNSDIIPRGVFVKHNFQHPRPEVRSALGVTIASGRRRRGRGPGLSCGTCGPKLGADPNSDTFTDPSTGCVMDTDGNLLTCPGGVNPYATQELPQKPTITTAPVNATSPVPIEVTLNIPSGLQVPQQRQQSSVFSGSSVIGNTAVSNTVLFAGVALVGLVLAGGKKRR